ncbi:hypothetical protein A1O1_07809 [Capronia coronata CBS 617.96]|uniref:Uncharacterized protein n=1 Tax=Capronia coronata CBS 617.96 TaxID=1182541 RepID=W9YHI5_9EURO|nr:uncharacterized protein A1O1_07809 [Capronia coronata CBS 617.96]EXJ81744.1 hypothetical protein A1O1_07809 [Capronia coronata CBS 617.96]
MIPPLAASTLANNPAFAGVWNYITTEVLQDDVSRKLEATEKATGRAGWDSNRLSSRDGGYSAVRENRGYEPRGEPKRESEASVTGDEEEDEDSNDSFDAGQEEDRESIDDNDTNRMPMMIMLQRKGLNGNKKIKEKKTRTKRKEFKEQLHESRVRRTKMQILQCLLGDLAYHPASKEQEQPSALKKNGRSGRALPTLDGKNGASDDGARVGLHAADENDVHANQWETDMPSQPQPRRYQGSVKIDERQGELRDLLLLISAYLDVRLSPHPDLDGGAAGGDMPSARSRALNALLIRAGENPLADEIGRFEENISLVADMVGTRVVEVETALSEIAGLATAGLEEREQEQEQAENQHPRSGDKTSVPTVPPSKAEARTTISRIKPPSASASKSRHTPLTPTPAISSHLQPSSSQPQPQSRSLQSGLEAQATYLTHLRSTLVPDHVSALTTQLHTLLDLQRTLLQRDIQYLESSRHGILHRHALSRLTFLTTVARAMELKARVLVLETQKKMETEETGMDSNSDHGGKIVAGTGAPMKREEPHHHRRRESRIAEQLRELDLQETQADERLARLEAVLGEYDNDAVDPGGRLMLRLGARYGDIDREIAEVRRDIKFLEGKVMKGNGNAK